MIADLLKEIIQSRQVKQVFLFSMHLPSIGALEEFQRIKESTKDLGDCFISYDNRDGQTVDPSILSQPNWIFTQKDLSRLGYYIPTNDTLTPGGNHWPVISFAQERAYDYYWNIEYDVRFMGDWRNFFSYFTNAKDDFITSHIRKYKQETYWYYWDTLSHPKIKINRDKYIRSFNPIYRISQQALHYIGKMHEQNWQGHHETLIPTLLSKGKFKLRDFGGTGDFVRWGQKNKFYIDSTNASLSDGSMRYRPAVVSFQGYANKLVHPVK